MSYSRRSHPRQTYMRILLQTTIPTTAKDWSIARFSQLAACLRSCGNDLDDRRFNMVMRDRSARGDGTRRVDDFGAVHLQPDLKVSEGINVENRIDIFDRVDAALLPGKDEDISLPLQLAWRPPVSSLVSGTQCLAGLRRI
jgi:hypothetical protein